MKDLYKFGVFLHNNKFWDALIEQIHVLPDRNIELVPRVGRPPRLSSRQTGQL